MLGCATRSLFCCLCILLAAALSPAAADDEKAQQDSTAENRPSAELPPARFGEDSLDYFVPLKPRTEEERQQVELLRDFATARALEDRRMWAEAIAVLEKALTSNPDSIVIAQRLCRLNFLLARSDRALEYARKVLDEQPGNTEILSLLVSHFERKNEPAKAQAELVKILANPRLKKESPGYLLIQRELGRLYADELDQIDKAADALAIVLHALDEKSANRLSLADQRRLMGFDEASTYGRFGEVFLQARRYEDAVIAFRRGLVYDPDHVTLPTLLTESLLKINQPGEALDTLESFLKRQPQGREPYEKLIEILTVLNRADEVLPRLEAAARNDPKNLPLQYLLADYYKDHGEPEKANELYRMLLATQPDAQGFGALATNLMREKKTEELIELLGRAFGKPETLEAVKPQIESIANDPAFSDQILEEGLRLQEADPPRLSRESRLILAYIANKAKKLDKLIPIQRLALEREPDPQAYREFWLDLYRSRMFADAAATLKEMFEKYPDQKDVQTLAALAQSFVLAGKNAEALEACEEALKTDDADLEALRLKGYVLGRLKREEEAIAHYQSMIERFPDNAEAIKLARSGLSVIYINLDELDKGEAELEILLERDPEDPGINNDLGYLYADRGKNLAKAEEMVRRAVQEEPDNPAYLDSLGWVLYKQGRIQEALEPLERAAQLAGESIGDDSTILDHLGDVYFKLGRLAESRGCWQRAEAVAANADPPEKRLGEIRKKLESLKELAPSREATDSGAQPDP